MFAALGSCASIGHVQDKSSACVEVLRHLAHEMSSWFGVSRFNRRHTEVSIDGDIAALCLDISIQKLHIFTPNRKLSPPASDSTATARKSKKKSAVHDILLEGMKMLTEQGMYSRWLSRVGSVDGTDVEDGDGFEYLGEAAFADPSGRMAVDPAMDPDFEKECPFTNADISREDGGN
jgi:hypothetical protein